MLPAATDQEGRPVALLLTDGQMSDHTGAKILYPTLPDADALIADKGYDSDSAMLFTRRVLSPASRHNQTEQSPSSTTPRSTGNDPRSIMFGRLKEWQRIAMRYDRCVHTFFSAICLAASVIFWL